MAPKPQRRTSDNITPARPIKMPKPSLENIETPNAVDPEEETLSPLGVYLKKVSGISYTAFARASGLDMRTVKDIAEGKAVPTLETAYVIEVLTKGAVPMESHLGTARSKAKMAELMKKIPDETRAMLMPQAGGGFAKPMEREGRGRKAQDNNEVEE